MVLTLREKNIFLVKKLKDSDSTTQFPVLKSAFEVSHLKKK